ncbi:unnamed protein product [Adineta ricciae]|uniref:TM2 domain-containing protein n=1 Tax=Adineta ricciae TaxID=249248 RepID=A0A814UIJ5_ADIRI|nr:unnamed protein product [Adineta ricciae]CAF1313742.1 unnamed protein product [Adineta ricciae]
MKLVYFNILILLVYFYGQVCSKPTVRNETIQNKHGNSTERLLKSRICYNDGDCSAHEQCRDRVCICVDGWVTQNEKKPCSYEQKSKWTAFLLSLFVGSFGADWFYLSRSTAKYIVAGVFKILVSCGCCCSMLAAGCGKESSIGAFFRCLRVLAGIASSIWWLTDWIRILAGSFPDGNGIALK